MKKKFLCVLLCAVLILSAAPNICASGYGQAPDFDLKILGGESTSISALVGSPMVLVFGFGSTPCETTLESLNTLLSWPAYSGVRAYMIDDNDDETVAKMSAEMVKYPNVIPCVTSESTRKMWEYLKVCAYTSGIMSPGIFFIDADGYIVSYTEGSLSTALTTDFFKTAFGLENTGGEEVVLDYADNYVDLNACCNACEYEWELLRLINKVRLQNGSMPLSTCAALQKAAGIRADELKDAYGFTRPDGRDNSTVLYDVNLTFNNCRESIAQGYLPVNSTVEEAWKNSIGKSVNVFSSSVAHLGVGYDTDENGGAFWSQIFMNGDCDVSSMRLLQFSEQTGESIDDMGIVVELNCERHGLCYMPLIEEMCSGYDPAAVGQQYVTVTYGSFSTNFTVADGKAVLCAGVHAWDEGNVSKAATCVQTGLKTRTCTLCGATETEVIPTTEHRWNSGEITSNPDDKLTSIKRYTCTICGATQEEIVVQTSGRVSPSDLTMKNIDGGSTTLSSLKGKPTVLVFGRMGKRMCLNTKITLNVLNSLVDQSPYSEVEVYFLEVDAENTASEVRDNMIELGYSNIHSCVMSGGYYAKGSSFLDSAYRRCTCVGKSNLLAYVFFIDSSGDIVAYSQGALSEANAQAVFKSMFGLDPCADGHTWNRGEVVYKNDSYDDEYWDESEYWNASRETVYTCTVCGATMHVPVSE